MFESWNEVVLSAIVLLCGGSAAVLVGRWLHLRPLSTILLYSWHSALGYSYSYYILENGGDAFIYYQKARFEFVQADLGTDFVVWLTSFPTTVGFTYWPLAFLYNAIGATGLIFFYAALRSTAGPNPTSLTRLLVLVCTLIPSLSFWTSGIGKDSIAFLSVGMLLWSISALERRYVVSIIGVLAMLAVRPHIAGIMVISVGAGILIAGGIRSGIRFGMGAIAIATAIFAIPLALAYVGTDRFTSFAEYVSERQEQNMGGGSSIDIVGMNPVFRVLSYLYRPLPNEAAGLAQFAASIDNMILVVLTLTGLICMIRAGFLRVFRSQSIALLYGTASLILLSQLTANLGLATRQKWMIVPALMLVTVEAWRLARETASARRSYVHGPAPRSAIG
jgi:hypothetical protein